MYDPYYAWLEREEDRWPAEDGELVAMREEAAREARMEMAMMLAEEAEANAAYVAQQADPLRAVCEDNERSGIFFVECRPVSDDLPF